MTTWEGDCFRVDLIAEGQSEFLDQAAEPLLRAL